MSDAENSAGKLKACQYGFPAKPSGAKWKKPEGYFLFGGIEMLTADVRNGKAITPEVVADAFQLFQRVDALRDAIRHRTGIHYPEALQEVSA